MERDRLRILWVKSGPLHPLDTGGKLRTYNMLKELRKRHHITFLNLESETAQADWKQKAIEYCHEVIPVPWKESAKFCWRFYAELLENALLSRRPYAIDKYRSSVMKNKLGELATGKCDIVVCDFLAPAVNFPKNISTPTLLFQHNVESEIWRRHCEEAKNCLKRRYFRVQWRRMAAFEKMNCLRFDGVVTVSPKDSETLRREFEVGNILGDVPAGVDSNYFQPFDENQRKPNRLVFTGSMDWLPNEDAVLYFAKEIYPRVKAALPDVTFTVVGRNPSLSLRELGKKDSSIHVTGTVADIRPHVAEASVMIVPLRIGGGTRIKIFEGMAMGIPIVSTTVGAEGLPVTHRSNILLADNSDGFAREIASLLRNADLGRKIADYALQMVRERHSWEAVSRVFESYCVELMKKKGVALGINVN